MFGKRASPAKIAQSLTVTADLVLGREFDPSAYPNRHLAITATIGLGPPTPLLPTVMAAVETLGQAGWELVSFGQIADKTLCAIMRRR